MDAFERKKALELAIMNFSREVLRLADQRAALPALARFNTSQADMTDIALRNEFGQLSGQLLSGCQAALFGTPTSAGAATFSEAEPGMSASRRKELLSQSDRGKAILDKERSRK